MTGRQLLCPVHVRAVGEVRALDILRRMSA
jgi:hypothetical protein